MSVANNRGCVLGVVGGKENKEKVICLIKLLCGDAEK